MFKTLKISFDVQTTCTQSIVIIEESLTSIELLEGLISGKYMTTMEISPSNCINRTVVKFDEEGNSVAIATITNQEVSDDTEYSNFDLQL